MADNDIFRTHVPRAFQRTSRDVIRDGNIERGVIRAIQALDTVSANWTHADIELLQRIHEATLLPCDSIEERNLRRDEIDEFVGQRPADLVTSIARHAKETLRTVVPDFEVFFALATARFVRDQIESSRIVTEAAIEYNRPIEAIIQDIGTFERNLALSPNFRSKLDLALRTETRSLRRIHPRPDLLVLLATPITDLAS